MPLELKDYENAILVQSAVNMKGITRSLADVLLKIDGSTETVNKHPIVRLYLEQMIHLNHDGLGDTQSYLEAYTVVEQEIERMKSGRAT